MSNLPRPIVRTLIACEEIRPDVTNPKRVSLLRVISTLRSDGTDRYPVLRQKFSVFALLTNGRGSGTIRVEIRRDAVETPMYRGPERVVRFPSDPLTINGASFGIDYLVFPEPGLYWVELWYDNEILAELPIMLK